MDQFLEISVWRLAPALHGEQDEPSRPDCKEKQRRQVVASQLLKQIPKITPGLRPSLVPSLSQEEALSDAQEHSSVLFTMARVS